MTLSINRLLSLFLGAAILIHSLTLVFYTQKKENMDEVGLFNPVYMFYHYNKITFPAQGHPEAMIPHPPPHYVIISILCKLGVSPNIALVLPGFLWLLITVILLCFFSKDPLFSISTLTAVFILLLTDQFHYHYASIRPDFAVFTSWLLSLTLIQLAYQRNMHVVYLFFGSAMLLLSSILHYYSAFAFIGLAFLWLWIILRKKKVVKPILFSMMGGFIVGAPYLLFFVIPNIDSILNEVQYHVGEGKIIDAVRNNFNCYQMYYFAPEILTRIFVALCIPFSIAGSLLLLLKPRYRLFALVSLPLNLFILFKSPSNQVAYFLPEFFIFWMGVVSLFEFLLRKFKKKIRLGAVMVSALLLTFVWALYQVQTKGLSRYQFPIVRYNAKKIVGNHATIRGSLGPWYISGAARWKYLNEIAKNDTITAEKIIQNVSGADYLLEQYAGSTCIANTKGLSNTSLVRDGKLFIGGFMLNNNIGGTSDLSFLLLSAQPAAKPLKGFLHDYTHKRIAEFNENPRGNFLFVVMDAPDLDTLFNILESSIIYNYIPIAKPDTRQIAPCSFPKGELNNLYYFLTTESGLDSITTAISFPFDICQVTHGTLNDLDFAEEQRKAVFWDKVEFY